MSPRRPSGLCTAIWTTRPPRTTPIAPIPTAVESLRITPGRDPAAMNAAAASSATTPADRFPIPRDTMKAWSQPPGWTRPTFAAATNAASQIRPPVATHSAP